MPPPSSPGPSNGFPRTTPDALPPFQRGQIAKSMLFSCSSGSLQPEALPTPTWLRHPPGTDILKLHEGLRKAESSLASQLRTGTNGLDAFFFQARVPSVSSPLCSCGRGRQTAKHVLIFCPKYAGARHQLRDEQGHLPDFSKYLGTADGLQKTTKWVMQRGILGQFRGARDALYGPSLPFSPALD